MTTANRKKAEKFLIDEMTSVTPNGGNGGIYKEFFGRMNDQEFDDYVAWLEAGNELAIWLSNTNRGDDVDFDDIVERCERLGRPVWQRIVSYDIDTGLKVMTPAKHFVGTAELMKQSQMWVKKISAAKDDKRVDDLTGQVMMESRATGLSIPEVHVFGGSLGLVNSVNELYTVKGGDVGALKAYRASLIEEGQASVNASLRRGDGAKVLSLAHFLLRGRLIENNLHSRNG